MSKLKDAGVAVHMYGSPLSKINIVDDFKIDTDRLKRLRDLSGILGLVLFHDKESEIYGDHPEDVAVLAELRDDETFKLIYDFANYLRTGVSP